MKTKLRKVFVLTHFFLLTIFSVNGQNMQSDTNKIRNEKNQYPTYFSIKIHYPELAVKNKIEGKVIVLFDIDSNCSVINRRIEKKLGYGCDEEALKVMDQYEIQLKELNKSICKPEKGLRLPVNFKL